MMKARPRACAEYDADPATALRQALSGLSGSRLRQAWHLTAAGAQRAAWQMTAADAQRAAWQLAARWVLVCRAACRQLNLEAPRSSRRRRDHARAPSMAQTLPPHYGRRSAGCRAAGGVEACLAALLYCGCKALHRRASMAAGQRARSTQSLLALRCGRRPMDCLAAEIGLSERDHALQWQCAAARARYVLAEADGGW